MKRVSKKDIDKDDLEYLITERKLSTVDVGVILSCSKDFIVSCCKYFDIKRPSVSEITKQQYIDGRKVNCKIEDIPSKDDIIYLYVERLYSLNKIKDIFETSIPTVKKWMDMYKIHRRTRSEDQMLTVDPTRTSIAQIGQNAFDCLSNYQWMEDIYSHHSTQFIADQLRVSSSVVLRWLERHNIKIHNKYCISPAENEVYDYVCSLTDNAIQSDRSLISPNELDIYVPDKNVAIEFDGIYWHSEGQGKSRKYHQNKNDLCDDKDVLLLHIFENEWKDHIKNQIWKSVIADKLGYSDVKIGARQTTIKEVPNVMAMLFLVGNHLQSACNSSVRYGLYHNGVCVSIMTFGLSRYNKTYKWELIRFCNKKGYKVHGSASKLLKHFRKNHTGSIISYANRRWSDGNLYEKLGFEHINNTNPNYFYWKDASVLESRLKYQKHKIENCDASLTEYQNMQLKGYDRIWDCGNKVYVLE